MSKLTFPHFTESAFTHSKIALKHAIDNSLPESLRPAMEVTLAGMERIRAYLGAPCQETSGYRSDQVNRLAGGVDDSQHERAEAMDFVSPAFGTPREVFKRLEPMMGALGIDQLILEASWVHCSFTLRPRCVAYDYTVKR